jgi:hypothetical protein
MSITGEDINNAYNFKIPLMNSTLGYKTNPLQDNFPPMMSDGRSLTAAYQPEAVLNTKLIQENNIKSNWEYRKYLTNNSQEIINQNTQDAFNDVGYYKRFADLSDAKQPIVYSSFNDNASQMDRSDSDLKNMYLSREQLNSRKFIPSFSM